MGPQPIPNRPLRVLPRPPRSIPLAIRLLAPSLLLIAAMVALVDLAWGGRAALGAGLAGAALATWHAWWTRRSLSRPLDAIRRAIGEVDRANLDPSSLPDRSDEIGALAEEVRLLADRLRRVREERAQAERLRLIRQAGAGLAHELRAPLAAARKALQGEATEPLRDALARVERKVRRFLPMARPGPPRFEVASVAAILRRTASGFADLARHRRTGLSLEVAADLPPVRVDPGQMAQALANLVANALDAAGPGGHVRLRAETVGLDWVMVSIEDDGPGLAAAVESRLFEPFVTTKPGGVGLGLALASAIVREQDGTIESDRAEGWTRFRVLLPGAASDAGTPSIPGPASSLRQAPSQAGHGDRAG